MAVVSAMSASDDAPMPSPLSPWQARPLEVAEDEPLRINQIQGNVIPGFHKPYQTLLFLVIDEPSRFQAWLRQQIPCVATMAEVLAFNRVFKAIRTRRGASRAVNSTWMNIQFSYAGLRKLTDTAAAFENGGFEAFVQDLWARAEKIDGITKGRDGAAPEGHHERWIVGNERVHPDALLIVGSDDRAELLAEVDRLEISLLPRYDVGHGISSSGAFLLFKQHGADLNDALSSREHFGFRDGVSQPAVHGRLSENHWGDVLTLRQNASNAGTLRSDGVPGQKLVQPGEFVLGVRSETVLDSQTAADKLPVKWAVDGSFLVFRRFRQDVHRFHQFIQELHMYLLGKNMKPELTRQYVAAKLLGRWPSGAPLVRAPRADDDPADRVEGARNYFQFQSGTSPIGLTGSPQDCQQVDGASHDQDGLTCPFAAHIRRAYPRDDVLLEEQQQHRLLRRGLPYGPPSSSTFEHPDPNPDPTDHGLLFLAYQASLEQQFEYIMNERANVATAKLSNTTSVNATDAGWDPIIGTKGPKDGSPRWFTITVPTTGQPDGEPIRCKLPDQHWVVPTGSGYFLTPSMAALSILSGETAMTAWSARIVLESLGRSALRVEGLVLVPLTGYRSWLERVNLGNDSQPGALDLELRLERVGSVQERITDVPIRWPIGDDDSPGLDPGEYHTVRIWLLRGQLPDLLLPEEEWPSAPLLLTAMPVQKPPPAPAP
jgi:Dyp-type peroxidase family